MVAGPRGYAEDAPTLVERYESVTFEQVHREVLHLFPSNPSDVLDVGAGSGRDAATLARRGHRVTAVEPTEALRAKARAVHADVTIRWIDDTLPELGSLCGGDDRFDLVLLTAVWMHLDATERDLAMPRIASILSPGGSVIMSLRHGPLPEGRRIFDVSARETLALGRRHGLEGVFCRCGRDALGRSEISWTHLCFKRP